MLGLEPRTIIALEEKGQEGVELCRLALSEQGINASGLLSSSARFEMTPQFLAWYAIGYVEYVDNGREPGGLPPITRIEQWILDKGISFEGSLRSFAWAIAKSIAANGTRAYQKGGLFLLAAVFTQEYIDQIKAIILDDISRQTIATIRRGFKLPA
jgi:hypothetical protein